MNCAEIECLMADVLGDEGDADTAASVRDHLRECSSCQAKFDATGATIALLKRVPDSPRIDPNAAADRLRVTRPLGRGRARGLRLGSILRYAAGLGIAFAGGYVMRGATQAPAEGPTHVAKVDDSRPQRGGSESLQSALRAAHQRNPNVSGLAKCLIAMAGKSR